MRVPSTPTRVGIFVYRNPDGSPRRELRPPEEVFHQDSLESLSGVALTVGHPAEPVTAANWKKYACGHVADRVDHDDQFVRTDVCVTDSDAVTGVESGGLVELSCGYECDFDPTPGVFQGQPYDGVQKNIRYNHLALLPTGRARGGSDVRLHLDEGEFEEAPPPAPAATVSPDITTSEITHHQVSDMDEIDKLKSEIAKVKAEADALRADNATLKARADAAEAAARPEVVDARVKSALKLREDARQVLGTEKALPEVDEDIMVAVITKRDATFKKDGLDATYLRARFDAEVALHVSNSLSAVQAAGARADAAPKDSVAEAQAAWAARNKDLYLKGGV